MIRELNKLKRKADPEAGQLLVLVSIFLLLIVILLTPLLTFMSGSLNSTHQVYEKKTSELYAADAGIEDAKWQIQTGNIKNIMGYSPYDFSTSWPDAISPVNDQNINVTIKNLWMPYGISQPPPSLAQEIIEDGKLIVTSDRLANNPQYNYKITVTYYPQNNEDLKVTKLGLWLPSGYDYVSGSSNLEVVGKPYYPAAVDSSTKWNGHEGVMWSFSSVSLASFPNFQSSGPPTKQSLEIDFNITPPPPAGQSINAVAWIETSGTPYGYTFTWDGGTRYFEMTSTAGNTTVTSYLTQSEIQQLSSAINGDYCATGKSLMHSKDPTKNQRELLLTSSTSTISSLPADAGIDQAYLYWTGWLKQPLSGSNPAVGAFWDNCNDFGQWNNPTGNCWVLGNTDNPPTEFGGRFQGQGHNLGLQDAGRYLEMKSNLDLSGISNGNAVLSGTLSSAGSLSSSDGLYYYLYASGAWGTTQYIAFSGSNPPNNFSLTIPGQFLKSDFKMKFYLQGFNNSSQYCYLDNILVMASSPAITAKPADTSLTLTINGNSQNINADPSDPAQVQSAPVISNGTPDGYYYACRVDVTDLIKNESNGADLNTIPPVYGNGNGGYSISNVYADCKRADGGQGIFPWDGTYGSSAFAGWSLVIIYSSPETAGHQLYLYDLKDIFRSVPSTENNSAPKQISGFLVPKRGPR